MRPSTQAAPSGCATIVRNTFLGSIVVVVALLVTSCAYALSWHAAATPLQRTAAAGSTSRHAARAPAAKPEQRRAGGADEEACYTALRNADVAFERVYKNDAPGVAWPIELSSALGGVVIR